MGNGMRFSYCMLPAYPLTETIETIKMADELGLLRGLLVDETWRKDPWVLFAAAADKTERIRFGPERHARVPARADADLPDGGDPRRADRRALELVVSTGNFGLLHQTASTGPTGSPCPGSSRPST